MSHDVLISYAVQDQTAAEAIRLALEENGVGCQLAPRELAADGPRKDAAFDGPSEYRLLILVLSPHAVASPQVRSEVRGAIQREGPKLPILPFQIAAVALDEEFRSLLGGCRILDASGAPLSETLSHLVRDVKRSIGPIVSPIVSRTPAPGTPVKVVLSYERNAWPDEDLAGALETILTRRGHQVFVDKHHRDVGLDWPRDIEQAVRRADVVIPLLSTKSVQREMVLWEVQTAHDEAQQRNGLPRILPVRVAFKDPLPPDLRVVLGRLRYFLWNGTYDNPRLVDDLIDAFYGPQLIIPPRSIPVGGLPLDSKSYIRRPTADDDFHSAVARRDSSVLIRGARQMGKTSLLARGLQRARESGVRVAFTDLQRLNRSEFKSLDTFFQALCLQLAEELDLDVLPENVWDPARTSNYNFEHYLRKEVLEKDEKPVIWALDEVDRLFSSPFYSEVFALFRSWHNKRSSSNHAPLWARLTLVIVCATEAHLFIPDLNQSPFNVGTPITLEDFTPAEVADLNRSYESPLRDEAALDCFLGFVGGHPFLVNRGLYELVENGLDLAAFADQAARDQGLFGDHLRRIVVLLAEDPALAQDVRRVLSGDRSISERSFYRLRSAGVMAGEWPFDIRPRCPLYATYLKEHLVLR